MEEQLNTSSLDKRDSDASSEFKKKVVNWIKNCPEKINENGAEYEYDSENWYTSSCNM